VHIKNVCKHFWSVGHLLEQRERILQPCGPGLELLQAAALIAVTPPKGLHHQTSFASASTNESHREVTELPVSFWVLQDGLHSPALQTRLWAVPSNSLATTCNNVVSPSRRSHELAKLD
jgi:hypothetical protein